MQLRSVSTFIKIVELNNFTRTAEALGYSQAAVTAQIKQLEDELGAPLFDRIGKSIRLTSAGMDFLPKAMALLDAEEAALASVRDRQEPEGDLRLVVTSSIAANIMPDIMAGFIEQYPKVRLIIEVTDILKDAADSLRSGAADLMFFVETRSEEDDFVKVYEHPEALLLVTSTENEISHIKRPSYKRIFEEPFIEFDRKSNISRYFREALEREGVELRSAMEIESTSAIVNLLLTGYGISFLNGFEARPYIESGELKEIDFTLPEYLDFEHYSQLFSLKGRWIDPKMRAFIDYIKENR